MDYTTISDPRCLIDGVPVFCAYDEIVQIGQIRPNPQNPNTHPDGQVELLAEIITANGWRNNITVSTRSGLIVRGHGRLLAAQKLGLSACPVEYQEYSTEAEELADLLADNRMAELSVMDDASVAGLLELIQEDVPLSLAGFDAIPTPGESTQQSDKAAEKAAEALDLDDEDAVNSTEKVKTYHYPKCGFVFEVT